MRILHVIPGIAPRYGGPSTAIGPMVAALNRLPNVSAEIATTDADGPRGRLDPGLLPAGVPVRLFRRSFSERWKYSFELKRWLGRHAADYDLIHTHALWSFASAEAGRAARRAGVPYLVRPAGMLSDYTWSRGASVKRAYWRLVERATVFGATGFHATSPDEADEVLGVRPDARTFVIPNGVQDAAQTVARNPGELRRRCGPAAGDRPIILFLSRLHPKKGVADLLLPAMANSAGGAYLALAGGEDAHAPGYEAEVRKVMARLGLGERVGLLGPIPEGDRWTLFDGASGFVLPSRSENFGIVVAEAMARGCPVVVTEGVQAKGQVIAAGAGWVVPCDPIRLAAALDELVARPDLRAEFGEAGRRYAAEHLNWDRVAGDILAMYQSTVAT